jgi:hypothetical protein
VHTCNSIAGEDLVFMLPRDVYSEDTWQQLPVLLCASLNASPLAAPSTHWRCSGSALTAADGKLYLIGGTCDYDEAEFYPDTDIDPSKLEVFDPHTGAWYAAGSPLPQYASLEGHVLLSKKAGGILLMMGGTLPDIDNGDWNEGSTAMYDIRAGEACDVRLGGRSV